MATVDELIKKATEKTDKALENAQTYVNYLEQIFWSNNTYTTQTNRPPTVDTEEPVKTELTKQNKEDYALDDITELELDFNRHDRENPDDKISPVTQGAWTPAGFQPISAEPADNYGASRGDFLDIPTISAPSDGSDLTLGRVSADLDVSETPFNKEVTDVALEHSSDRDITQSIELPSSPSLDALSAPRLPDASTITTPDAPALVNPDTPTVQGLDVVAIPDAPILGDNGDLVNREALVLGDIEEPELSTHTAPDIHQVGDITKPTAPTLHRQDLGDATINGVSLNAGAKPSVTTSLSIGEVALPSFDMAPIETFDLAAPELSYLEPTSEFSFTNDDYTVLIRDELLDVIRKQLAGDDTSEYESAIYERAKDREAGGVRTIDQDVARNFAARGFMLPPTAVVAVSQRAREEMAAKLGGINRDIMVNRIDRFDRLREQAMVYGLQLEQVFVQNHNAHLERALNVARFTAEQGMVVYNALAQRHKDEVALWQVQSQVRTQWVDNALKETVRFEAKLKQSEIKFKNNEQKERVFSLLNQAKMQLDDIRKTEIGIADFSIRNNDQALQLAKIDTERYLARLKGDDQALRQYAEEIKGAQLDIQTEELKLKVSDQELKRYQTLLSTDEITLRLFSQRIAAQGLKLDNEKLQYEFVRHARENYLAKLKADDQKLKLFSLVTDSKNVELKTNDQKLDLARTLIARYEAELRGNDQKLKQFDSEIKATGLEISGEELKLSFAKQATANMLAELQNNDQKLKLFAENVRRANLGISIEDLNLKEFAANLDSRKVVLSEFDSISRHEVDKYRASLSAYDAITKDKMGVHGGNLKKFQALTQQELDTFNADLKEFEFNAKLKLDAHKSDIATAQAQSSTRIDNIRAQLSVREANVRNALEEAKHEIAKERVQLDRNEQRLRRVMAQLSKQFKLAGVDKSAWEHHVDLDKYNLEVRKSDEQRKIDNHYKDRLEGRAESDHWMQIYERDSGVKLQATSQGIGLYERLIEGAESSLSAIAAITEEVAGDE